MERKFNADDTSLVVLFDLANCKVGDHLNPFNLRVGVSELHDVTSPVTNSFVFAYRGLFVQVNHHGSDVLNTEVGHSKLTLVFSRSNIIPIVFGFLYLRLTRLPLFICDSNRNIEFCIVLGKTDGTRDEQRSRETSVNQARLCLFDDFFFEIPHQEQRLFSLFAHALDQNTTLP